MKPQPNKIIVIIFFCSLFFSCTQNENTGSKQDTAITKKSTQIAIKKPLPLEKKSDHPSSTSLTDTVIYGDSPAITPLPFGYEPNLKNFRSAQAYFINLLYQHPAKIKYRWPETPTPSHKIYRLPQIKSVKYFSLSSLLDGDTCKDGKNFGDYINLKKYRYRLPDLGKYQCYYWSEYPPNEDKTYSFDVRDKCDYCLMYEFYGYFILYEPDAMSAKVFTIYYDTEQDTTQFWRFFWIDKNYNIRIFENNQPGDGPDKPELPFRNKSVSISKDGEIKIEKK